MPAAPVAPPPPPRRLCPPGSVWEVAGWSPQLSDDDDSDGELPEIVTLSELRERECVCVCGNDRVLMIACRRSVSYYTVRDFLLHPYTPSPLYKRSVL